MTLPSFVVQEFNNPNAQTHLLSLDSLVFKIARHAQNIHTIFTFPHDGKQDRDKVVDLGLDFLKESEEIKTSLDQCEDLSVEGYFVVLSQLLEALEGFVSFNYSNLANKALSKHIKHVVNTVLSDTCVMEITNAWIEKYSAEEEIDPEDPDGAS